MVEQICQQKKKKFKARQMWTGTIESEMKLCALPKENLNYYSINWVLL